MKNGGHRTRFLSQKRIKLKLAVGMNITKRDNRLESSAHRKSTNTGLLLNYHSHVDKRQKDCMLTTTDHRAHRLLSTPTAFSMSATSSALISLT